MSIPTSRIRTLTEIPIRSDGKYVLYWMTSARRTRFSFALDHAIEYASELQVPLVILEALRVDYRWASDRFHRFVLDGMAANERDLQGAPVLYYPYVEPRVGAGKGLLAALSEQACVTVTDDFPSFFLPRMLSAAAKQIKSHFVAVDGNGLLPLSTSEKLYPTAYVFRRFMQKTLPLHLAMPKAAPFDGTSLRPLTELPASITERWPRAPKELLARNSNLLAELPLDHSVGTVDLEGGSATAGHFLSRFLEKRLARYADERHLPDAEADSQLSPFLHFGHISVHEVVSRLFEAEGKPFVVEPGRATGKREGFWGVSGPAESFLDEVVTWRELGHHTAAHDPNFGTYTSVPGWARQSLARHASDPRAHLYTLEQLDAAQSSDEVWNAAQMQLKKEGRIHNAVRMIWGKKVLEWTSCAEETFSVLEELNNRYALDGRNPNSYSGISWCLGKFDRPWGPERPIFGVVRYMTTDSAKRKYKLKPYIERYRPGLF